MIKLIQLFNDDDFYKKLRVTNSKINKDVEIYQTPANLYFSGVNTIRRDIIYLVDFELVESYFDKLHQLSTSNFIVYVYKEDKQILNQNRIEKLADHYLPYIFNHVQLYAALSLGRKNLKGYSETIFPRKLINSSVSEIEKLLNSVSQRVFWKNTNGMYIGCNANFTSDFCIDHVDDIIGKTDADILDERAAIDFSAYDNQIFKTGEAIENFEKEIEFKNGEKKWLKISKYPHMKEGLVIGIIGKYEIISSQDIASNDVFSDEKLLEILMNTIPDTIYFKDSQSRFLKINEAKAKLIGIKSTDDAIGKTDFDFFNADLAKETFAAEQKIIFEGGIQNNIEFHGVIDGKSRWMNSIKAPIKDIKGNSIGIVGVSRDVSKLVNTEHQLKSERDLLQLLIDHIPSPIYFKDMDSVFTRVNVALAKFFGVDTIDDVIGKTDFDFHKLELAKEYRRDEENIIKTGKPIINKIERSEWDNENIMWLSTTKIPLADEDGTYRGIVGISHDATEQILIKQRLEYAKQKAEEASKAKSNFLSNMSHEIRTPMNGIIGMAEVLSLTSLDEEQKNIVDIISRSGNNLLKIINDILDLSKIDAGKLTLERAPVNINELISEVAELMMYSANEAENVLKYKIDSNIPVKILGDSLRLKQVLLNLLSNSIKFTNKGNIEIEVRYIGNSDVHHCVLFKVSDTGIGMDVSEIDQIFEAFSQADASSTRKYGGTGLGLAISSKLIRMMGGKLNVKSKKGEGSTFYFELLFGKVTVSEHNILS